MAEDERDAVVDKLEQINRELEATVAELELLALRRDALVAATVALRRRRWAREARENGRRTEARQ